MAEEIVESLQQEPAAPPPERTPINETPADGPGSGRGAIRKELEKSVESARKAEQKQERPARQPQRGRAREHIEEMQEQEAAPAEQEQAGEQEQEAPEVQAPAGWAKEAKAEWGRLPPAVQAAVAKRETDMAKGVEDLKKSYADIDAALKPRMELIRRHGHTAGAAVNQLFAWFEALSANPVESFPALARSFNFDLKKIPGLQAPAQPQQTQQTQQPQPGQAPAAQDEVPPYIKSIEEQINELKNTFGQQINMLGTNFQQASQEKTNEILMAWSKDKPYFEDVRRMMGHLISSGAVQPLPNGNADLDNAYDMAVYAMPEVRAKVLADQQAKAEADRKAKAEAEKKAQQAAADKARRASGSLAPGAPGAPASGQPQRKNKGKSVRESIMEARQELSE